MEDTNRPEGCVRVVWEILPGDSEHVFREFDELDLDPGLFSPDFIISNQNFPVIKHFLLDPVADCLDRLWTQTAIKINYQSSQSLDEYEP